MDTIPLPVAALTPIVFGPEAGETVGACARDVAGAVEVDLGLVRAALGDDVADWLAAAYVESDALWRAVDSGDGGEVVAVERELRSVAQRDAGGAKIDLVDEFDCLDGVAGVCSVVAELTAAEPDLALLEALAAPFDPRISSCDGTTSVELTVHANEHWPPAVGGPPSRFEVSRRLVIHAHHAPWRDRRRRRLSAFEVHATELFAASVLRREAR